MDSKKKPADSKLRFSKTKTKPVILAERFAATEELVERLDQWRRRQGMTDVPDDWQPPAGSPTLEASLYTCTLIHQKLFEWETLIQKVLERHEKMVKKVVEMQIEPKVLERHDKMTKKQIEPIQQKIEKAFEAIFEMHGHEKWPDEVVSKLFFHNYKVIEDIFELYKDKKPAQSTGEFIRDNPQIVNLLNEIELNSDSDDPGYTNSHEDKLDLISTAKKESDRRSLAIQETAAQLGTSEGKLTISSDRIQKKIKKIYE